MLIDDIRNHLAVMNVGQRERRGAVLLREAVAEIERLRLTDAEREAILYCVSCAQDYRDTLDGSDDRATQMIEIAMRLAVGPAPVEGPRTASVADVGGAGPTITDEEREALEIAVEYVGSAYAVEHHAATLRGLLERTSPARDATQPAADAMPERDVR